MFEVHQTDDGIGSWTLARTVYPPGVFFSNNSFSSYYTIDGPVNDGIERHVGTESTMGKQRKFRSY